jgi:hypothetical protein
MFPSPISALSDFVISISDYLVPSLERNNAITVKNVSPLPHIDTIMEDIAGMIHFSGFNL